MAFEVRDVSSGSGGTDAPARTVRMEEVYLRKEEFELVDISHVLAIFNYTNTF